MTQLLLIVLLASGIGTVVILWVGSNVILLPRVRALEDRHHDVLRSPEDYGITLERFAARTGDGHSLQGFLVHPSADPDRGERSGRMLDRMRRAGIERTGKPRGTIVLLHGRGGLKENMLTIAQRFVAADFRCIVYDARAHGESGGGICTFGKRETGDVSAVLDRVSGMLDDRGEELGSVFAFGLSLGASVVLQGLPGEPRIEGATVVAPFADFGELIHYSIARHSRNWIPAFLKSGILHSACLRGGFSVTEIRPEVSASRIEVPVFLVHGGRDRVIPIEQGRRIFRALPVESRRWREVPDGFHYNVLAEGGDDLYEEMIHFYLDCLRGTGSRAAKS